MKSYGIVRSEDTLNISRKNGVVLLQLGFFCLFLGPWFALPVVNTFIYRGNLFVSIFLILIDIPFFFTVIEIAAYLPGKEVILDKSLKQVLINKREMLSLTDVKAVNLGSYIVPTAKDQPFSRRGLYLMTSSGTAVEIEREVYSGPSRSALKEVALAIANF